MILSRAWIAKSFIRFLFAVWGLVQKPYETYRKLSLEHFSLDHLVYLGGLIALYFFCASFIRVSANHPLLLTLAFGKLSLGALAGYLGTVAILIILGYLFQSRDHARRVLVLWAYSYIPTILWFLSTTFLYILLPPPRSNRFEGIVFSIVYLAFSISLLFWKGILYFLTLRFGLRIPIAKIALSSVILIIYFFIYAVGMYQIGIFRIPFL